MTQPSASVNVKLIESLAQIIFSLNEKERELLEAKIKHPASNQEIKSHKEALQQDINLGVEQLKNGNYIEYDDSSLPGLLENIKMRGKQKLKEELRCSLSFESTLSERIKY